VIQLKCRNVSHLSLECFGLLGLMTKVEEWLCLGFPFNDIIVISSSHTAREYNPRNPPACIDYAKPNRRADVLVLRMRESGRRKDDAAKARVLQNILETKLIFLRWTLEGGEHLPCIDGLITWLVVD